MKFCSVCDNMYYMRVDEEKEDQLVYYCRNCGNVDKETTDNMCVLHTNFKRKEQKFHNFLNEFTKLDPTLPRLNNMNFCESINILCFYCKVKHYQGNQIR